MSYPKSKLIVPFIGADQATSAEDYSISDRTFSRGGAAEISNDQSKFAGAPYGVSGKFTNTTGNYFGDSHNNLIDIGTGDYTIAGWVRINSTPASNFGCLFIGDITSNDNRIQVDVNSSRDVALFVATTSSIGIGGRFGTLSLDTWHHLAWTRSGTTTYGFLDGTQQETDTNASAFPAVEDMPDIFFGRARTSSTERNLDGYLQDWQIVVGEALWTANFTPPSRLVHTYSGTVKDGSGDPLQRRVIVLDRDSGYPVADTDSDSSGDFSVEGFNAEALAVALDADDNAGRFDRIPATTD